MKYLSRFFQFLTEEVQSYNFEDGGLEGATTTIISQMVRMILELK